MDDLHLTDQLHLTRRKYNALKKELEKIFN